MKAGEEVVGFQLLQTKPEPESSAGRGTGSHSCVSGWLAVSAQPETAA